MRPREYVALGLETETRGIFSLLTRGGWHACENEGQHAPPPHLSLNYQTKNSLSLSIIILIIRLAFSVSSPVKGQDVCCQSSALGSLLPSSPSRFVIFQNYLNSCLSLFSFSLLSPPLVPLHLTFNS